MGVREMICILISSTEPLIKIDRIVVAAVQRARTEKTPYINIIFLSSSTTDVFKYRDIFTKYIDIGVRVFIENSIEKLREILSENCKDIFLPSSDENLRKNIIDIEMNIDIIEV
jgi:hypothetical protein